MATKSLAQKLYIRPSYTVALLNAPKGMADALAPLPEGVTVVTNTKGKVDLVLNFVKNSAELEKAVKDLKESDIDDLTLWFAYPKVSSKTTTDLTRDQGWKPIFDMGYEGVASIAIDATWSGLRFKRRVAASAAETIDKQYTGDRTAFRPIYEQLLNIMQNLGPDVEVVTRQSYVAFARGKQFALIKPAKDRVDLALKLPHAPLSPRLEFAQGLGNGNMTSRVRLTKVEDIDRQLISWIQDAYRGGTS